MSDSRCPSDGSAGVHDWVGGRCAQCGEFVFETAYTAGYDDAILELIEYFRRLSYWQIVVAIKQFRDELNIPKGKGSSGSLDDA